MTPHAEQPVPFKTVLFFIDAREIIPYSPQVGKSRFTQEAQEALVSPFGRMVQAGVGIFHGGDGTEQQIAAKGGGNVAVLIQSNGVITAPDLASVWTLKKGKLKLNDRTRE